MVHEGHHERQSRLKELWTIQSLGCRLHREVCRLAHSSCRFFLDVRRKESERCRVMVEDQQQISTGGDLLYSFMPPPTLPTRGLQIIHLTFTACREHFSISIRRLLALR